MNESLVTVYIDGEAVALPAGKNLLEALLERDVNLPYFCWHPEMGSIGACRQCAVLQFRDGDDDKGRIVMSCMTPVTEGALFSVADDSVVDFRRSVVEGLMINHPHDCPVCEEGGECHLQDMTVMTGHRDRRYRGNKVTFRNQYLGPLISHEMNRCITCYRCVRFYQDYAGGHDLGAFASRDRVYFGRSGEGVLENEFAGNLVEVCPTGVFTDKPLSLKYTRKWDLQSAPSVCRGCSLGCNISASERYGELRRIHNRYNHRINGYFLCDRGRFGGDYVNSEVRLRMCGIRNEAGKYEPVTGDEALDHATGLIGDAARVVGIGSPRASLETNHLLHKLAGDENFYSGMNRNATELNRLALEIMQSTPATLPTMAETEDYDAVLILGEDVTNHAPRLALSLRQATRNEAKRLADDTRIPRWNDAAVRKLAQDERSPVIVATPCPDRLDEIAVHSLRGSPDAIAAIGFALANRLDGGFPAPATEAELDDLVSIMSQAKQPLVVSGTGLQHRGILKAAANVAAALAGINPDTGLMLCADECNSMGVTLMGPGKDLESLLEGGRIDTAIVVENDLALRLTPKQLQALRDKINHLVVLDQMDNDTTSISDLALPAATFAETEATLVNNEGTAQRSFAALPPAGAVLESWRWLLFMGRKLERPGFSELTRFDHITQDCAGQFTALEAITDTTPGADWRFEGMKVARMPPRYSGRTAMHANISVHEPKRPQDPDSPLAFSMEGIFSQEPSSLRPYVWSPGWNSNQAINKFQQEIAGPCKDGDPGVRLLSGRQTQRQVYSTDGSRQDTPVLVPRHHIFGSEELSNHAKALSELVPRPYCAMGSSLAKALDVETGDGVEYRLNDEVHQLEVVVDPGMADDCIAWPFGLAATRHLIKADTLALEKATNWTRRASRSDRVIGSDRTL